MGIANQTNRRAGLYALLLVIAATVLLGAAFLAPMAQASPEDFALESTSGTLSVPGAGQHADFENSFQIELDKSNPGGAKPSEHLFYPWAATRDIDVQLPPGLTANPSAFPTCETAVFFEQLSYLENPEVQFCPIDSQVGLASFGITGFVSFKAGEFDEPLYNLEAPGGDSHIVARLGYIAAIIPIIINVRLDPKRGYSLDAEVINIPNPADYLTGSSVTTWGVPTDHSHDHQRYNWYETFVCFKSCSEDPVESGLPKPTPFMRNATSCEPAKVGFFADSYEAYGVSDFSSAPLTQTTDCDAVPFEPTASLAPTTRSPGTASGLDASLHVPQEGLTDPEAAGTADIKEAKVTLPQGFSLNASAADGLGSCSEEQIGLDRNERQIVDIGAHGAPVSLSFRRQSTPVLPNWASAEEVQSALEALPNIGPGDISVSGRVGGPWIVDFRGSFAGQDVPPIGGTHSELDRVTVESTISANTGYSLRYGNEQTATIPHFADAEEVQAALEALQGIGAGNVEVIDTHSLSLAVIHEPGPSFRVVFTGALTGKNVAQVKAPKVWTTAQTLAEGASRIVTETVQQGGEIRFTGEKAQCPESSKVATGEIRTPVLKEPLRADFYLAKQSDNPFDSLFAGYLVAEGAGALVKVPARIDVDPNTGQVTTTFANNPQTPFEDLELHFKGGNRALLTTPDACGTYSSSYELTPWSGNPPLKSTSEFTLDQNCGAKPFNPGFKAGSETALAGSFTTFATQVTNDAGAPDLRSISVELPEGLSAQLAGVGTCPDEALEEIPTETGTGAAQIAHPSCPANSQIGVVQAGTGSGSPFFVRTGKVYLSGPYKGAPLSLAAITPAVAGPFDLGNVLVRVPVSLDRRTARAHAVSDPIPTMLSGIPLDVRDIRVLLDRQGFALNPTDCDPEQATGTITAANGATANVSDRFQVGECAALGFKPKLSLKLKGGTKRGSHPALTAVFRPRPGDANTSYVQVALPKSEFLDQSHIGTVCTRVQFDAQACPAASIYGKVSATTPLLGSPLTGNVYLRSSNNKLPDLVMDLHGPPSLPIHLEADGRIDSIKGGIRTTFEFVPDAPITRVVLQMQGAGKGLLQNSRNICASTFKAQASFAAHNGRVLEAQPPLVARCKGAARKGKAKAKAKHRG
jgi:hypothetical protein